MIQVGSLYKMKSPKKRQDIIVEIITVGWSYLVIDIYIKGKKNKRRRHLDIKNNGFEFNEKNIILNLYSCKDLNEYILIKDEMINEWRNQK